MNTTHYEHNTWFPARLWWTWQFHCHEIVLWVGHSLFSIIYLSPFACLYHILAIFWTQHVWTQHLMNTTSYEHNILWTQHLMNTTLWTQHIGFGLNYSEIDHFIVIGHFIWHCHASFHLISYIYLIVYTIFLPSSEHNIFWTQHLLNTTCLKTS